MSTQQIKSEIQRTLDTFPESTLQDILNYLKSLQDKTKDEVQLSKHLKRILSEDKDLLERLAK